MFDRNVRPVVLFADNCSRHVENDDKKNHLRCTRVILRKFPKNATDLVQPADSFVIQKLRMSGEDCGIFIDCNVLVKKGLMTG